MDITLFTSVLVIRKDDKDSFDSPFYRTHNIDLYKYYDFTADNFSFVIDTFHYRCLFEDLTIGGVAPIDIEAANLALSVILSSGDIPTGATGQFTTSDGQTVTVDNGIVIDITETVLP